MHDVTSIPYGFEMPLDALSPTVITGWLACEHSLTLRMKGSSAPQAFGEFADLVREKGTFHERDVRQRYLDSGLSVFDVPEKGDLSFEAWASLHRDLLETTSADVIYQMPMVFEGIKGVADFLIRVEAEPGFSSWEPVDAKLARSEGKPGHILQLCFYADAVTALTGSQPKQIHLELGSGLRESYRFEEFGPYWRRMKLELGRVADEALPQRETEPEPCSFCAYCDFQKICEQKWVDEDSLVFVANLLKSDRAQLKDAGITTLAALATSAAVPDTMPEERFERVAKQARLQKQQREHREEPVPFEHVPPGDDPIWGHGYSHLPRPDQGDVFFDLEGHPLFTSAEGIFFLFGLYYQVDGQWVYEARWAHSLEEQTERAIELVRFFDDRRQQHPEYHVYHYNHTERSSLSMMVADTEASVAFGHLAATGLFVDLLTVVRNSYQMGVPSYGLKDVETVIGFQRSGDLKGGSGAVLLYEAFLRDGASKHLDEIALYNENDVRSTWALRDWLLANRPDGVRWRDPFFEEFDTYQELDEVSFQLLHYPVGTLQHLMGNLVGYWRRERSAQLTPLREKVRQPVADLLDDEDVITALQVVSVEDDSLIPETGQTRKKVVFTWPEQLVDPKWDGGQSFIAGTDGETNWGTVSAVNLENRTLSITWKRTEEQSGLMPVSVILDDWVKPAPKDAVLLEAAQRLLEDPSSLPEVTSQILLRAKPRFRPGGGPQNGIFSDDKDEMVAWAPQLDRSVVAVQGPPGTGKTYRGARMVRKLLQAGKRVGITAPSHSAISNFMEGVVSHFEEENDLASLKACQRISSKSPKVLEGKVEYASTNPKAANARYDLVAGTSWFFCSKEMQANPVDYLIVDEAGQVSLADVATMSLFVQNVILLGDPLQLDQVSNATHPEGSGESSLEYMLAGDRTIAPDRGVFIEETRRMHPDICHFISSQIYDDRLHSHASCAQQVVEGYGSGLRWIEATHQGNSTKATEEAEIIAAKILELLGSQWTNQHGETQPLRAEDFMVVAPFNDQKDEIRRVLERDARTAPVADAVGTVDKFQGREAPVVFFSMTTSDGEATTRGADFLFSRSRLNVAVSRARSLAYLICTDALLGTKAASIENMRLIGTLNSFVEMADKTEIL